MKKWKDRARKYVTYGDGEVVFEEGSDGKEIYFIISGEAEISRNIAGRKEIIDVLEKGGLFGEMAALNDDERSMTIIAVGELQLYELFLDEMFDHMRGNPELLKDVCTSLAGRLRDANLRIHELTLAMVSQQRKKT